MLLWEKIVDETASASPDTVILPFWRGESLLHPAFTEMIEYALSRKLRLHMSTNGHSITEEQMKVLLKLEYLSFSFHSKGGLLNAKNFIILRGKNEKPLLQGSFVDCETELLDEISMLISTPRLGGFDSIRMYKEHSHNGAFGASSARTTALQRKFCPKLQHTLVIGAEGSVSRCNHQWVTETKLTAVSSSIVELWNSRQMRRIREEYPDKACRACSQWSGRTQGEEWRHNNGNIVHKLL